MNLRKLLKLYPTPEYKVGNSVEQAWINVGKILNKFIGGSKWE